MKVIFGSRWVSLIAVVFGGVGAVLMFIIGAVTTVRSVGEYVGAGHAEAFSSDAALDATVEIVSALDEFLMGLVLLVFAFGVYSLFIVSDRAKWDAQRESLGMPQWLNVTSVAELKITLLETIAILLAALFLKGILMESSGGAIEWSELVVPLAVFLFGATIWLLRRSHPTE